VFPLTAILCLALPVDADPVPQKPATPAPLTLTNQQDYRLMLEQLRIAPAAMRHGPSGFNPKAPDYQNIDEAKANPWPNLPEMLVTKSRQPVATPELWWKVRRPEILEYFDSEVYGRVPANVPKVTWEEAKADEGGFGGRGGNRGLDPSVPAITKRLVGRVDNSACPAITVNIRLTLILPAKASGPVPVMMDFGGGGGLRQYLAKGWGYALLNAGSIQADNGAGLTRGIIGLVNKGQPRKPDDWGSLRAWAWGASRALDYLETDKAVDAKQVGISGLSRFGKAALVAMAYEPRFAIGLIGSSGEGGAKLHRRYWGEQVENLTGSGEYHWMCGNFLKYGGPMAPCDLPVDAHELIALCAPRPTFISYGASTGPGAEGYWVDQKGSFMAAAAAGPAFRLLGKKDLGTATMPPAETALVDGELAWRMHKGGHTTGPNIDTFVTWASRYLTAPKAISESPVKGLQRSRARTDRNSQIAHQQLIEKTRKGRVDVYFIGDSITRRWGATDYPDFLANWNHNFHGWNAGNFGWGGDTTQNILWRLENGELDGVHPRVFVVMAGTNNLSGGDTETQVAGISAGLKAIVDLCRYKCPEAVIVLMGITPRNDRMQLRTTIDRINERLAAFANAKEIRFLSINDRLADKAGVLLPGMSPDRLHLSEKAYQVWADALKPILTEALGAPAQTDLAPPPTGDPKKQAPDQVQDWPQWRGPARDGAVRAAGLPEQWPEKLTERWKVTVGEGHATPLVVGDKIYVFARQGDEEGLACLDLATGRQLWRSSYAAPYTMHPAAVGHGKGPKSTPTAADGKIFALGISGILSCFDATTGNVKWRKEFAKEFPRTSPLYGAAMSLLVHEKMVIAHVGGHDKGAITAFDVDTGNVRWTNDLDGPGYASPVLVEHAGGPLLITQTQNNVVAIEPATGKLHAKTPFKTAYDQNIITPVVYKDLVIYSGFAKPLTAVRITGDGFVTAWENKDLPLYMSTPVLHGDQLFGMTHQRAGQLFCVDAASGKTLWRNDGRMGQNAALVNAGSVLLVLTNKGHLLIVRPSAAAFELLRGYHVSDQETWAQPVLCGKLIFVKDKTDLRCWSTES
jgi:outer membrane protein assembly factor BamB/lysophospholipase L1-like esterase